MAIREYRRGRMIGRGACGTVSLATDASSGEIFAVKSSDIGCSAALQREQRILSALDSPFVVSYLGFDVAGPAPGFCRRFDLFVEYAPGGSLSDAIEQHGGRLEEPAIRCYARDVLRGLDYLHSAGVVHCDIKSRNVLLCGCGHAKIADFGCARLADEAGECSISGTPLFMSPEVARGEEQGAPADVWALGCTVIEMATGRSPWADAKDPVSALHRIAFSTDVPEIPSSMSEQGKEFLSKCLVRNPRERWTAAELLRHPFVVSSGSLDPQSTSNCGTNFNRVSPVTTLDQSFWELISDDEDVLDQVEVPEEDPLERIKRLAGNATQNWTWDENWVTVRSHGREESSPATDSVTEADMLDFDPISVESVLVRSVDTLLFHYNFDKVVNEVRSSNGRNSKLYIKPFENLYMIQSALFGSSNSTIGTPLDPPPAFTAMPKNIADRTPTASGAQ
ncbi:hypothetical protein ZIOFF_058561 [Zingiber officinale]|uniref:Protein kinase domain-containing protein n=1 Tax=Zingiber officinale TaxID=94328 RepID=A0A8J5KJE5_ZINOF|nr:hypothetical protein ZIOFF_058561 [Zingiber officinale]